MRPILSRLAHRAWHIRQYWTGTPGCGHGRDEARSTAMPTASIRAAVITACAAVAVQAAEWTWTWTPAAGDAPPSAAATAFKYGKDWAYAVEIDDGPKWVRDFAVPFLAAHAFTDAPPGIAGGRRLPFVGSVAAVVANIGFNDAHVSWDDLRALREAGWGVMNHSFDHRGYHWKPEGRLDDDAVAVDAWWSQALLAAGLGGRAPTGAVYANGYVDYNRGDALARNGVGIATRVGGSCPRELGAAESRWMDFPRNYLDEGVWAKDGGAVLAQLPGADGDGPAAGSLIIDFTHGIERDPASANHRRWKDRLTTIAGRWGADGADRLWCAPTAEVADYVRAARAARITVAPGRLGVSLPDGIPGSALTIRIRGGGAAAKVQAPAGGALHRQGADLVLTTPNLGTPGAPPPSPRIVAVYDGPAVSIDLPMPARIAGVVVGVAGGPKADATWRIALRTAAGARPLAERTLPGGRWTVGGQLCPLLPLQQPVAATGLTVEPVPELRRMVVWAVAE